MKHHNLAVDFFNLDFEKIDTEVLADEAKEQEETNAAATIGETDVIDVGSLDPSQKDGATTSVAI